MGKQALGPWQVKKNGVAVSVIRADSSVVAILPEQKNGDDSWITEAYLLAAAPQLFEACCKINSILENNLIITAEGFKINCSEIQKSLSDALMRAMGYRKSPEEP